MKNDSITLFFGIYYSIWHFKTIPNLLLKKYICWGCVGATGAFIFYHSMLDTYFISTFNHESYKVKALKYMKNVIKKLYKISNT